MCMKLVDLEHVDKSVKLNVFTANAGLPRLGRLNSNSNSSGSNDGRRDGDPDGEV